jgi:CheY-like chemotaxis protein
MKKPASILVVDDNPDLLSTFSLMLKRRGYNVDTAEDGLAAVDKFRRHYFDVTLMDVVMPGMNGVEAFRRIREISPGARVILMSAYYDEEELKKALKEGVYSAVRKPVDVAQLMEILKEAALGLPILIVDDDADFCRTMARVLEVKGYRVDIATSGKEAIRIARKRDFRVAFIDANMPVMDGMETHLRLKEINSGIATIMMTAYRDEASPAVEKAKAASIVSCLYKPFDFSRVEKLVQQIAEK